MNYSIIRYILCRVLEFQAMFLALPCLAALIYGEKEGWAYLLVLVSCLLLGGLGKLKKTQEHSILCEGRVCGSVFELDTFECHRSAAPVFVGRVCQLYRCTV